MGGRWVGIYRAFYEFGRGVGRWMGVYELNQLCLDEESGFASSGCCD